MFPPTFPPEGLTKITEVSPSKKLLDVILQEGCDVNCLTDTIEMVNPSIDLCLLVENAKQFMLEDWQNFQGCLEKEVVVYDGKEFVHLTNFPPDPVTKGKITRRFKNLKESYMHFYSPTICMKHQKGGCNLVPKHIAFLFYLGLLIDTQPQDPQIHSEIEQETYEADAPISFQSVSTIENLGKAEKLEEEHIDLAIEEKESANLDSLFNIREDYCFAAIAEASQVAKEFVDIEGESKEEFLSLDLETSNQKFLEAPDAFGLCLKRVAEEEPALKDEDFETRLVELGIEKFGRNIVEPDKINFDMGAKINLEHEGKIEADELQKIELLDEVSFLGRAGGSRATSKYTGHDLIHYLPKLDKDVICAFHSQFSDHPELPMFAIKTLSRDKNLEEQRAAALAREKSKEGLKRTAEQAVLEPQEGEPKKQQHQEEEENIEDIQMDPTPPSHKSAPPISPPSPKFPIPPISPPSPSSPQQQSQSAEELPNQPPSQP
ncbi:hypothetical protein L7F22_034614 [Adiantum nelumboides]|nr:hypothetical protein [Adiantum nelumboides]